MDYQRARGASEKEERRASILDASKDLFAAQGVDATGIDQIATRCGLSRSLLYTYYLDKHHIFIVVVAEALDILCREFEERIVGCANGLEAITSIGWAYVQFSRSRPEYYDAIVRFRFDGSIAPRDPDGKKDKLIGSFNADLRLLADRARRIDRLMVEQIELGMADGSMRTQKNPEQVARALWAMIAGLIQSSSSDEALIATGIEIAKKGLTRPRK